MKLFTRLFVFSFVFFIAFSGCKKTDETTTPETTTENVTDDEIADAVAKSLVSSEGGVGLAGVLHICGKKSSGSNTFLSKNNLNAPSVDSTFTKSGNTQYASYQYTVMLNIKFVKNENEYQIYLPSFDTAKVNMKAYGSVTSNNGKYLYMDTTYLGNTYVSGISQTSDTVTFSGTAYYFSNFNATIKNRYYNLATMMTFTSLKVPKSTYEVSSGTVNISIQSQLKNGGTITATGTITFNGNQTATLTFNNKSYVINLNSGLVVA